MSIFDDKNQVKSSWMKWGKVGDNIAGTLIEKRQMKNKLKEGEPMQTVYDIKVSEGEFHNINEDKSIDPNATELTVGEIWSVGGKEGIDAQFRNIKRGEIVGLKFVESVPSKQRGYSPTKVIKIYTAHEVDPTFMQGVGAQVEAVDDGFGEFPGDNDK